MAGGRREPSVTRKQSSAEMFGERDVSRIIRRQIVTKLPNPGQQNKVGIPCDSQVEQVPDRLIGAVCRDRALPLQTSQYLANLKIEQVRSVQGFVLGVDALFNLLAYGGLEQPVNRG